MNLTPLPAVCIYRVNYYLDWQSSALRNEKEEWGMCISIDIDVFDWISDDRKIDLSVCVNDSNPLLLILFTYVYTRLHKYRQIFHLQT